MKIYKNKEKTNAFDQLENKGLPKIRQSLLYKNKTEFYFL